jgi:hypothetical protein
MSNGSDILKDALGLSGAVLMALPWIRDFLLRRRRDWLRRIPVAGSLAGVRDNLAEKIDRWIDKPKDSDLYVTIAGIGLLALSFFVGLWSNILRDT